MGYPTQDGAGIGDVSGTSIRFPFVIRLELTNETLYPSYSYYADRSNSLLVLTSNASTLGLSAAVALSRCCTDKVEVAPCVKSKRTIRSSFA